MDMMEDKIDIMEDKKDTLEDKKDMMEDKKNIFEEAMEAKIEIKKETDMEDKIKVLKTEPNYQHRYVFTDVYEPNWKSLFV